MAEILPLTYDPTNTFLENTGISPDDLRALGPRLEQARAETLADVELSRSGMTIPEEKQPLDSEFLDLPERLLAEYDQLGETSEVGRLLATARRLAETVDRVVLLGIGGSYMGARALFESCCHPLHNELSRGARGGYPRLYFDGNNLDNDATQGLLDLLGREHHPTGSEDRWGIVVISKSGGTLETAAAFRTYLSVLLQAHNRDRAQAARLVVPVTGSSGSKLLALAQALGCPDIFSVPEGVGGRFSVLSAVGLLPAAVLGLDIRRLLEGAAAMNQRFRTAAPGENPVLDYVGVCHLMEAQRGASIRVLSTWGKGLEAAGLWYDQLLSESLGKEQQGATPLTCVNTRDLHSRGQQHQEGRRDKLITNLIVEKPKRDRRAVGHSELDQDELNRYAVKTLPDILDAAIAGTNKAYYDDQRPTADLRLPLADEASLGQFFQMMMLATVVEGRLIGINPYGQPGVEAYKKNMKAILAG